MHIIMHITTIIIIMHIISSFIDKVDQHRVDYLTDHDGIAFG
jgi:hypothetical protein